MSATIDTNLLLYAVNPSEPLSEPVYGLMENLTRSSELLYVFWPVVMGFLRLATHSSLTDEPLTPDETLSVMSDLLERPHVRSPGEGDEFLALYRAVASPGTRGKHVTDAQIAALMRQHGVQTIYTRDRDFRRFDGIRVVDPFA